MEHSRPTPIHRYFRLPAETMMLEKGRHYDEQFLRRGSERKRIKLAPGGLRLEPPGVMQVDVY
jgi:hypothetical protein